ncbi:polyubiquitin 4 [Rhizophagus clarus]|uniref:Polyubiquitin 4 n=1 Tax=Rhizophagus clarus TaxID=94130 RepID=A0A8H3LD08_9GLOM|nr:polyubiquitin 4 [Rhizophagus clarus]
MYLISVPNLPPVFSILVANTNSSYLYRANVTMDTTIELLLKCFKAHVNDGFDYKLRLNERFQSTDTLEDAGLKENDFIYAFPIPLKLYVKMQNGKVIELYVPGSKISIIKSTIKECEDIPVHRQRLFFNGKQLEDSKTLKDYNIQKESTLELISLIELNVKAKDGRVTKHILSENDTIHDVKQMVQKSTFVPVYNQYLFFYGKQLHDSSTLKSCNIQNESTLELAMAPFKLNVKTQDGKVIELYRVTKDNTIHEVRQMIQEIEDIPDYKQCLLFDGIQLDGSSTLKSYNVQNESTLELAIVPFKLNVKTQDGKVIELYNLTKDNTINEVKQIIQEIEGIPGYKQRLTFGRNQLRSSRTLKDYGIHEWVTLKLDLAETSSLIRVKTLTGKNIILSVCDTPPERTLHLVYRLRGGMFQDSNGRIDFSALPSLMQYMQVPERQLHDKVHVGIACNYCGKSEWKGARYKCSECLNYDLCYECIKISKLLHDKQHNFSEILEPENQDDFPKDIPVNHVTILPILPTKKEEMLNLLQEEEKRRLSPAIQQEYYKVGSDPTSGKDWMDVTDQMQHDLVREFGYSDEAVQLLRRAPQLYQDDPAFRTTQVYVRNNIASIGNLKEERLFVLLAGSYTCPLYRYISHVLNDIYNLYKKDVDFYMIQIREAHASDVWPIGNIVEVKEHRTLEERLAAARKMIKGTYLEIPVLADTMDNTFLKLYSPWPFRFFIIKDGILKLVGMPKEARYDTTDLVNCLDALLDEKSS